MAEVSGPLLPEPDLSPVPLAELKSIAFEEMHRSSNRLDPFWSGMAGGSLVASWESREAAVALADAKGEDCPRELLTPADEARGTLRRRSPEGFDALAAITMWRTLSIEQLAAFGGWDGPLSPDGRPSTVWYGLPRFVRRLWVADLVDRGSIRSQSTTLPTLWRPSVRSPARNWVDGLDFDDWVRLTGGGSWTPGGRQGDLHNMLTAELALRLAEHTDVATVLGESLCGFDSMMPDRFAGTRKRTAAGDMVAVREDGLRIVFETTVRQSRSGVRAKVRRWVNLLTSAEFEDSGIVVCFLEAMPPEMTGTEVTTYLREEIQKELAHRPESVHFRVQERMSVAKWRWWFPDTHAASAGFSDLLAFRPTGSGDDLWEPVPLLDQFEMQLVPRDQDRMTAIIANSRLLAGVPKMIRDELDFQFGEGDLSWVALEQMGLTDLHRVLVG